MLYKQEEKKNQNLKNWRSSLRERKEWRIMRKSLDEDTAYSDRANGRDGAFVRYEKYKARDDHTEGFRLGSKDC